jgi:hypothetical protein
MVLFLLINFDLNPAFCCRKIKKGAFFSFPGTIWETAPYGVFIYISYFSA